MEILQLQVSGVPMWAVLLIGTFTLVFVALSYVLVSATTTRRALDRRITRAAGSRSKADQKAAALSLRKTDNQTALEKFASGLVPNQAVMRARLQRTGHNISVFVYLAFSLLIAMAVAVALYLFAGLSLILSLLLGITLGAGLPHMVVGTMVRNRRQRFLSNFPEAIDLIVRGIKSGMPVAESIKTVAAEIPDPVGTEFKAIIEQMSVGEGMERAMWTTAERLDIPEFRFFVVSLSVQAETGGNLAETLSNLADILRKRRAAKLKVRALSSEARMSAYLLGGLPFFMFGLLYVINSDYISLLITDIRGNIMLGAAVLWMFIGFAVMKRMITFEI
ncbi:MAG: type II secretion system F family protein [Rhodospirillaceae bacterium]|nr:type II secretion system F family protein [Rhodospirillaceae bacterium]